MVTSSDDKTLCLWDLKDGVVLKEMEGHGCWVKAVAVSKDGKLIASGDGEGKLMTWDGDTGESLTEAIKAHSAAISSLDFSPHNAMLATASWDNKVKLWGTDALQIVRGAPSVTINVGVPIHCVRYSPSDKAILAIATNAHIQIWNPNGLKCIAKLTANCRSFAWTPDGRRLLAGPYYLGTTIREWDTTTWTQVGGPWGSHSSVLAVNSTGTLLASASLDNSVRLWRISDRRIIAVFRHSKPVTYITFCPDGKYILCGCWSTDVTEWGIPENAFLEDISNADTSSVGFSSFQSHCHLISPKETSSNDVADEPGTNDVISQRFRTLQIGSNLDAKTPEYHYMASLNVPLLFAL